MLKYTCQEKYCFFQNKSENISRLAKLLLDRYPMQKGKHNLDKITQLLEDVLLNLKKRQNSSKYDPDTYKTTPYNYVVLPLTKEIFIKNNNNPTYYQNYSYIMVKEIVKILQYFNISRIEKGVNTYKNPTMTKAFLNPTHEWTVPDTSFLTLASLFNFSLHNYKSEMVCREKIFDSNENPVYQTYTNQNGVEEYVYDVNTGRKRQDYRDSIVTDDLLNKRFEKINNHLPDILKYKRIFGRDIYESGRFYNQLQFLPKPLRKKILEEKGLIELDYSSMNPNILYYYKTGKKYEGDMYNDVLEYMGIHKADYDTYRPMIKQFFLSVFSTDKKNVIKSIRFFLVKNGIYLEKDLDYFCKDKIDIKELYYFSEIDNKKYAKTLLRFNNYLYENNKKCNIHYLFTPEYILSCIEKVHGDISEYFYTTINKTLTNIESKITESLMLDMIHHNIEPLTIHDCILVPESYKDIFIDIMNNTFKRIISSYHYIYIYSLKEKLKYYNNTIINKTKPTKYLNPILLYWTLFFIWWFFEQDFL